MAETIDALMYAPQARLVDLASGKIIGTNVTATQSGGGTINTILSADLISAKVTLPNTGIAQLQVTLNNQRFFEGAPAYPPWKYNNFSQSSQGAEATYSITLGQRLRLDLRYSNMPWSKLIVARVTDLQFSFPSNGGSQLTVIGEDMLSALKVKPKKDVAYDNKQEEAIASATLDAAKLGVPIRTDGIERRAQPLRSARHQKSQTYFQFLTDIADRLDCELFTDFQGRRGEDDQQGAVASGPIDVKSEVRVVMEPARSKVKPQKKVTDWKAIELGAGEYLELRWGMNLIDFTPKLKVWEMPTSAVVAGSHPDRRGRARGELSESDVKSAIELELPKSTSYDVEPIDAVTARTKFFGDAGDDGTNQEAHDGSHLDETRAKIKALALVMKKVREFMTAEATTIGTPMLRPGVYVHILGLRPPFDGFYYVTKTVHTYDGNGYRTQFSLRRPGMLPPSAYLTQSSEERAAAGGSR